jgi:type I restriction enzyme R subunit
VELTKKVKKPESQSAYPATINSPGLRSLYDNLKDHVAGSIQEEPAPYLGSNMSDKTAQLAVDLDRVIRNDKKAGWRGNKFKEKEVRIAIKSVLGDDVGLVGSIFEIVKEPKNGY